VAMWVHFALRCSEKNLYYNTAASFSEAAEIVLKRSYLGSKHRMTPLPARKTKEVSGDQGGDRQ